MKANIIDKEGKKGKEIDLPPIFGEKVREDLILKVYLASLHRQPYAPSLYAGMLYSASGKLRHRRRKWKTTYGYGISRIPRKLLTRRGSRFFWVGATVASTRGGRRAHPPKVLRKIKKINKKEKFKAIKSAISSTSSLSAVKKRYTSLKSDLKLPIIFSSEIIKLKIKDIQNLIKKILSSNIKPLFILGNTEKLKIKSFEAIQVKGINIQNIASGGMPGRLIIYTEQAIKDLENLGKSNKEKKK